MVDGTLSLDNYCTEHLVQELDFAWVQISINAPPVVGLAPVTACWLIIVVSCSHIICNGLSSSRESNWLMDRFPLDNYCTEHLVQELDFA